MTERKSGIRDRVSERESGRGWERVEKSGRVRE